MSLATTTATAEVGLELVDGWLTEYVCRPHEINRAGPSCPSGSHHGRRTPSPRIFVPTPNRELIVEALIFKSPYYYSW